MKHFQISISNKHHITIRVICALVIYISFYAVLRSDNERLFSNILLEFISDWQTLIAGLIAFVGAFLTVKVMRAQRLDHLRRTALSTKSELSPSNAQLYGYLQNCLYWILEETEGIPDFPSNNVRLLSKHIEFTETSSGKNLFNLVNFFQVHNARLTSPEFRETFPREAGAKVLDTLVLANCIIKLWEYARNENAIFILPEITRESLKDSFRQIVGLHLYCSNITYEIGEYIDSLSDSKMADLNNQLDFTLDKYNL